MKGLVVCRLLPATVRTRLELLTRMPEVESLTVVRAAPGPPLPGVTYLCPPSWLRWRWLAVFAEAWIASRAARRQRPDFVHGIYLVPHGLTAILSARLAGCPAIVAIIGTDLHGHLEQGRRLWRRFLVALLRRADGIFATGRLSASRLAALGLDEERIRVLPNGVDLQTFAAPGEPPDGSPGGPADGPLEESRDLDLLFVGRLVPGKRPLLVVEMVRRLTELRGRPVRAALLGEGPLRSEVEARLREYGLAGSVKVPGHVDDVPRWLARSRLLVLPTVAEGLPYAILEAMAAGVPTVVSAVGDLPDLLADGEAGILTSFDDLEATVGLLHDLLGDDARRARIARAARTRVGRSYSTAAAQAAWRDMLAATVA